MSYFIRNEKKNIVLRCKKAFVNILACGNNCLRPFCLQNVYKCFFAQLPKYDIFLQNALKIRNLTFISLNDRVKRDSYHFACLVFCYAKNTATRIL